jgi:hypothetical protein
MTVDISFLVSKQKLSYCPASVQLVHIDTGSEHVHTLQTYSHMQCQILHAIHTHATSWT